MIRFINPGIQPPIYLDTANQRVGIGLSTPSAPLEIMSAAVNADVFVISAFDGSDLFNVFESSSGHGEMGLRNSSGTANVYFRASGVNYINNQFIVGGTSPNSVAILQADSTTRGFLPPRMTTTQKNAISTPPAGLVVYDSTLNKLCVYTGAAWETVTSV